MKLITYFLGAVLLASVKGQATECDYDYVCDDIASPEDLVMSAPSPRACYEACRDSKDGAGDPNCAFWTYYEELGFKTFAGDNGTELNGVDRKTKASGHPVCRRLTSCNTRYPSSEYCSPSQKKQKCASGPGSCEPCDLCDRLNGVDETYISHWSCNINDPYRQTSIPPTTVCRTQCPSSQWTDGTTAGSVDAPVKVKATCNSECNNLGPKGLWTIDPVGATIDVIGGVPTPTLDAPCLCEDIKLGVNQMPEAFWEEGAEFYCDQALIDDGFGNLNTMQSESTCQLYCHGDFSMDIKCMGGFWSAGVKTAEDIYCFGAPTDCQYATGVNPVVCNCVDGATNELCSVGKACIVGACLDVCQDAQAAVDPGCFCEAKSPLTGGTACAATETCTDGVCA